MEWLAGRVVSRFTDECVVLQDNGINAGMPDLLIDYRDRQPGYVEVWTDIQGDYAAMWSRWMSVGRIPYPMAAPSLSRAWQVTVSGAAFQKSWPLERELEALLRDLELRGMVFERVASEETLRAFGGSVARLLDLGVVQLASAPSGAGVANLYPAGTSGPAAVSWEPVLDWISATLSSPQFKDNRRKLAATGAHERHMFIGATFTSPGEVFFALKLPDQSLPQVPPSLPHEMTHLWLVNAIAAERVLAWFPDRGWIEVIRNWATD